ncbi:hypothetical protein BIW11_05948 [Tropilaelaps mercedesae]|uniref:Uncharacterized protein n=1 Tax=Tropilaelaps mercedesae TaxID=418985 RepID=A0A1V9Y0B0_9ACAR|nr:hypothetical protein BIW11_05948 [Tropilaelaps mercedesae]
MHYSRILQHRVSFCCLLLILLEYISEVLCSNEFISTHFKVDEGPYLFAEMKAELAAQGPCWTYAVERLEKNRLEPEGQERLAFDFANCFIEGAGVRGYYCREAEKLATCKDFIRMQNGPHNNVYSVFYMQSQLLVAYLKELAQQFDASQKLKKGLKNTPPLSNRLASALDLLLDSLKAEDEVAELKRLAVKSHSELRANMRRTERLLADISDMVGKYKIFSVTVIGITLFATNIVLRTLL